MEDTKNKKPIILFLSWRDIAHPQSGGAEVFTTEMLKRSKLKDKYTIVHYSTEVEGSKVVNREDNIVYIRKGNWVSVIFFAFLFYLNNIKRIKFVVDQCNTHRFFIPFWVAKDKQIFFIHQLTREIWKIKLPFYFAVVGEFLEDLMLRLYSKMATMTVSDSTKNDLFNLGFKKELVDIIPEGVAHTPVNLPLELKVEKNLFLYVGRYSEYKGLPDATKAFIKFLKTNNSAQFVIIGSRNEKYIDEVLRPICVEHGISIADNYDPKNLNTITLLGRVSEDLKLRYMRKATALIYPSKREGWGLGVSEAGILGTPSIVYNSPGLIDAVDKGRAGYLCEENTVQGLYENMQSVVCDQDKYESKRRSAYDYSSQFRWENTALAFDNFILGRVYE